jgi:hypothetical protein
VSGPTRFMVRKGQREFEKGVERHRIAGLVARRQYGKTTIASRIALKKMMKTPGHTVIFGSIKIDLGREIVRKEAETLQKAFGMLAAQAQQAKALLEAVETKDGQERKVSEVNLDDWSDIYEHSRLEFRLYHSRSVYSRTKVVALTPDAVGETGDVILDEVGRAKRFREVVEAMTPIIASNPEFRCIYTTTPPPEDNHFSYELLAPPVGTELPPNPLGNWYRSDLGVWVLRIDAWDAWADGIPLYDDDTGEPLDPDTARSRSHDKEAWDRNYGVKFLVGGSAAIGLIQLDNAQRRGVGRCTCIVVHDDIDFDRGIHFLREKLVNVSTAVAAGLDIATTEKNTSNPTALTVAYEDGVDALCVVTFVWKTRDPAVAKERIRRTLTTINARPSGGRARRLCVDATNERYFATEVQREMADLVMVETVVSSETVEQPGSDPITKKAWLGNKLVAVFNDARIIVAPDRYLKTDMRLVRHHKGTLDSEVGPNGEHGDTFDSHKLAIHALTSTAGGMENTDGISLGHPGAMGGYTFKPRMLGRGV